MHEFYILAQKNQVLVEYRLEGVLLIVVVIFIQSIVIVIIIIITILLFHDPNIRQHKTLPQHY